MSITQVIALAPPVSATVTRLRSREAHASSTKTEVPPNTIMPGTRQHLGTRAVHLITRLAPEEIEATLPPEWDVVAAQLFDAVSTPLPVPLEFVDWLDDIPVYDDDGNEMGTVRPQPGVPLHKFAGAADWIWEGTP